MSGNGTSDPSLDDEAAVTEDDYRSLYFAVLIVSMILSMGFGWCLRSGVPTLPPVEIPTPNMAGDDDDNSSSQRQKFVQEHLQSSEWKARNEPLECSICLAPVASGDSVSTSQNPECSHSFHRECVYQWLLKRKECPLCRNLFLLEEDQSPTTSEESQSNQDRFVVLASF